MTTYLIQILFGATILLLTAIILCSLFRKAAASLRYRIWTFTMLGVLLLPILSPLLPTTLSVPMANSDSLRHLPMAVPMDDVAVDNSSQSQSSQSPKRKQGNENVPSLANATGSVNVGSVIVAVWFIGTVLLLAHLLLSIVAVRKMLAPLEHLADPLLDTLRKELGIKKPVRLICCNAGTVPFISGIFRPTIVLPPQSLDWSEPEHRAVLTHELAHVARHDLFWQLLTQVVCAVYWFHPLIWFAAYRIGIERESACDDTVVLRGEKPSTYADLLLELANGLRKQRIGLLGCTVAITRKNTIGKRIQAVLNPNLCRTPLGKIGTGLFLVFAVGAIVLIATVSPFAQQEDMDENNMLAKIAIREDAPKFTIKGKVLNPDGTPADRASVRIKTIVNYVNSPSFPGGKPGYYPATGDISSSTDREGNFEFTLPVRTTGILYAHRTAASPKLVSPTFTFVSRKDAGYMTFRLFEGYRLSGLAMFEDGTPAVGRTISAVQPLPAPRNWENQTINDAYIGQFTHEFQARVQPDGKYELYLPPGDFMVKEYNDRDGVRAVPISIAKVKEGEAKQEHRIDFLAVPAPLRVKFVKEDGSDPGRLEVSHMSKSDGILSARIETGGEFLFERHQGSVLVAVTDDRSLGVIYPVPDDKLSEVHTVVLQPTATVKLELRDRLGQPVVGERVSVSIVSRIEGSSSSAGFSDTPSITDEAGVATFKVPPGRGFYEFSWEGGKLQSERTLSSGETVVITGVQG